MITVAYTCTHTNGAVHISERRSNGSRLYSMDSSATYNVEARADDSRNQSDKHQIMFNSKTMLSRGIDQDTNASAA